MLLAAALLTAACGAGSNGPVEVLGADGVTSSSIAADAGDEVVFGQVAVRAPDDATLELHDAELVGDVPPDAATVVDVRVVTHGQQPVTVPGAAPWPYEDLADRSDPLQGYVAEAGDVAELLVVVEVQRPGTWTWPRTTIHYSVAGERFERTVDMGFRVCVPADQECDPRP